MSEVDNRQIDTDMASERRIGEMFDLVHFGKLYDLAVETCLQQPREMEPPRSVVVDAHDVAHHLGVRGISTALNCLASPEYYGDGEVESPDSSSFYISTTSPVRYPRAFSDKLHPGVQEKIHSFGEGLLAEAYLTLGADVHEYIRAFREAENDEEQIQILDWLHHRIKSMTKRSHTKERLLCEKRKKELGSAYDPDEEYFYHPIRLSPKVIGQYPHHRMAPTCLGISVITSSFAEQAGARHLHAGVMMTHHESLNVLFTSSLGENAYHARQAGSDMLAMELYEAYLKTIKARPNRGTHAVTLIQLKSGSWYVVDPNYNASYQFNERDSGIIGSAATTLQEYSSVLPRGIELDVDLGHRSGAARLSNLLHDHDKSLQLDEDLLRELLTSHDPESLSARAYDIFSSSGFPTKTEEDRDILHELLFDSDTTVGYFTGGQPRFFDSFDKYWQRYVLWGMSNEQMMARCRQDEAFLARRIKDIKQLPWIALSGTIASLANDYPYLVHYYGNIWRSHDAFEVGEAAYRIGCAVLSDFSSYCDTDLSPSFWLTYWPGKVPVTETSGYMAEGAQRRRINTALGWLSLTAVAYYAQNGIIIRFEEQRPAE